MDDQQRDNIRDDLKGIIKGDLLFDELSRVLYSTDASIFQVLPLGVVVPRHEEDVQNLVRYAAEHRLSLVARGAGSGLAGESLGSGLIVDLSRHFRSIIDVGSDTVRVQPGVVYRELNDVLAKSGRRFGPNPASGTQCTIGGMVATNASGSNLLLHGYTREHVRALRAVLDSGDAVKISRHSWEPPRESSPGHVEDIVAAVVELLDQNEVLIHSCRPRTPYNRCAYLLHDVLASDVLDLARLLVGSEGTLALFTEATLGTIPVAASQCLVLFGFATLDHAVRAAQLTIPTQPAACDLMDHRLLTLARGCDPAIAAMIPAGTEFILLVEYESDTSGGARQAAADLALLLYRSERLAQFAIPAFNAADMNLLGKLREASLPKLYGSRGHNHPVPSMEDIAVPVENLLPFLRRVQEILQKHETTASFLVHAATGSVHTRPFLDVRQPEDVAKLWVLAEEIHSLALDWGGTVSTQHGTGLARTPWVARQYGPLYSVFKDLKEIFDPRHIFNPGKIVGPDPGLPPWPLPPHTKTLAPLPQMDQRYQVLAEEGDTIPASSRELRWRPEELPIEAASCNRCGLCRTEAPAQRMCPIFRATQAEAATPRAKANLMTHLLEEGTDSRSLSSDQVRVVADLCVNCKMCALECPSHVNIPKLMLEAKAANVAEHGLDRSAWVLARTEAFAAFGSDFSFLVNAGLRSRSVRWLLEKFFGISRRRHLPTFAGRSFLNRADRRGWARPPRSNRPRVAYFVDVFANYNDPQIAEAVVAVLHHQGIEVYVPPGQIGCGSAPLAQGDMDSARQAARANLRVLADLAREGYPIICSEPTAALMLRQDYLNLMDDPDALLVSDRTIELTSFLWALHQEGRLRTDFHPLRLSLGHHVPCHLKALGQPPVGPSLLSLIPQMRVHTIDVNCSGMAGTFGLAAENYEVSLEAGRPMLQELNRDFIQYGSTECSTCRLQMEEGTGKRTLHPVQYLALAYNLMPELKKRLAEPIPELVLQ